MGRHPQPRSEKEKRGTLRPDKDRSHSVTANLEAPEPPATLDGEGLAFWHRCYQCPWITAADQTQVLNVARQLNRQAQLEELFETAPEDFRLQRALKELDKSIESGLDQLLLTPNARRRAGIELAPPPEKKRTPLETMRAWKDREISDELYKAEMESHEKAKQLEQKREEEMERLRALSDKSLERIEALFGV